MDVAKHHEFALRTVISQGIFNLPSDISPRLLQEQGGGDLNISFGFVLISNKKIKFKMLTSDLKKCEEKVISD